MKRRRKKVYIKWFLSYVAILLPPIMIGFVIVKNEIINGGYQALGMFRPASARIYR